MPWCTHTLTPTPTPRYTNLHRELKPTPSGRYPLYWCISSSKFLFKVRCIIINNLTTILNILSSNLFKILVELLILCNCFIFKILTKKLSFRLFFYTQSCIS